MQIKVGYAYAPKLDLEVTYDPKIDHKAEGAKLLELLEKFSSGTVDHAIALYVEKYKDSIPKNIILRILEAIKVRDCTIDRWFE